MTYKYAVVRGRLVLDRALTANKARKVAVAHIGAGQDLTIVVMPVRS